MLNLGGLLCLLLLFPLFSLLFFLSLFPFLFSSFHRSSLLYYFFLSFSVTHSSNYLFIDFFVLSFSSLYFFLSFFFLSSFLSILVIFKNAIIVTFVRTMTWYGSICVTVCFATCMEKLSCPSLLITEIKPVIECSANGHARHLLTVQVGARQKAHTIIINKWPCSEIEWRIHQQLCTPNFLINYYRQIHLSQGILMVSSSANKIKLK